MVEGEVLVVGEMIVVGEMVGVGEMIRSRDPGKSTKIGYANKEMIIKPQ